MKSGCFQWGSKMNKDAQALGRLAKGVPKTLTDEQRTFRAEQLAAARLKRHKKPKRTARRSNKDSATAVR